MSRGGALLRLGRIAEAQAALSGQLEAPMPMQCRAICRALLAEASAAQGDREAARTWFDEAMRLLPAPQFFCAPTCNAAERLRASSRAFP